MGSILTLGVGGRSAINSPLDISGLHRWFDLNVISSLFTTSGGSTNVAANNDPIGRIEDLSGNGRHITQATSGFRGLYKTNQDGTPAGKLDETDDFWQDTSIGVGSGFTIFTIAHATRSSFPGPSNNTDPIFTSGVGGGSTIEISFYNAFVTTANPVSVCQQANSLHYLNGAPYTEFNAIGSNRTHASMGVVGSPSSNTGYYYGKYSDSAHFSPDAFKGQIVYSRTLSVTEILQVFDWIMTPGRYRAVGSSW